MKTFKPFFGRYGYEPISVHIHENTTKEEEKLENLVQHAIGSLCYTAYIEQMPENQMPIDEPGLILIGEGEDVFYTLDEAIELMEGEWQSALKPYIIKTLDHDIGRQEYFNEARLKKEAEEKSKAMFKEMFGEY